MLASCACAASRALATSPALACALATSPSTVRSTRPHRSGTQLADSVRLKKFEIEPPPLRAEPVLTRTAPLLGLALLLPLEVLFALLVLLVVVRLPALPPPPPPRERDAEALICSVGKKLARACVTIASAWRKRASALLRFWFEMSIWRSRPSRTGSGSAEHQGPRR